MRSILWPNSSLLSSYWLLSLSATVSGRHGPFSVWEWHSSVNISATRTSFAMILDAYESPTRRLSYVVPFISNFEVFYVKIYRTLKSFHTDNLAIRARLGMRIDAWKGSTLKLSHVSKLSQNSPWLPTSSYWCSKIAILRVKPDHPFCPVTPFVFQ